MSSHAIILRLGGDDTAPVNTNGAAQRVTEAPFFHGKLPATRRVTHELLCQELRRLGLVPTEVAFDLLVLAVAVFAGDTRTSRDTESQDGWTREIEVYVPVSDPDLWNAQRDHISRTLRFLTGDLWNVQFRSRAHADERFVPASNAKLPPGPRVACLFSGGLDSFVGAIDLLRQGLHPVLVGHHKSPDVFAPQKHCAELIQAASGATQVDHFGAYLAVPKELFGGVEEKTERARSFLFLSLGILVSSSLPGEVPLVVPENGLIALNVPLTPLRLGSLSTRTAHPFFLSQFQELLHSLNLNIRVYNPYQFKTKGEMLRECRDQSLLRQGLAGTMSCSHPTAGRWDGAASSQHCGRCVPCIIRRAAIKSACGPDPTEYALDVLSQPADPKTAAGQDLRAFAIALARIARHPEYVQALIRKSGPLGHEPGAIEQYADLYRRGMAEVSAWHEKTLTAGQ